MPLFSLNIYNLNFGKSSNGLHEILFARGFGGDKPIKLGFIFKNTTTVIYWFMFRCMKKFSNFCRSSVKVFNAYILVLQPKIIKEFDYIQIPCYCIVSNKDQSSTHPSLGSDSRVFKICQVIPLIMQHKVSIFSLSLLCCIYIQRFQLNLIWSHFYKE